MMILAGNHYIKVGLIHLLEMGQKRAPARSKSGRVFGHPSKQAKTELRVGLYAGVSTHDQQTIPLQIRALWDYAARRGSAVAVQIKKVGSGA